MILKKSVTVFWSQLLLANINVLDRPNIEHHHWGTMSTTFFFLPSMDAMQDDTFLARRAIA